jgi:hypothetical protein
MTISNKTLWIFAALGAGAYALTKYGEKVVGNIHQSFVGLKWLGISSGRANFSMIYRIENKNTSSITLYGFKGVLTFRNQTFTDIASSTQPLVLTPSVSKEFIIYFSTPLFDAIIDLGKLLLGQRTPQGTTASGIIVKGDLDVEMSGIRSKIPFTEPIVISF